MESITISDFAMREEISLQLWTDIDPEPEKYITNYTLNLYKLIYTIF